MRQEEENRPLRIYQCEDTQDGILTAVYEAGVSAMRRHGFGKYCVSRKSL